MTTSCQNSIKNHERTMCTEMMPKNQSEEPEWFQTLVRSGQMAVQEVVEQNEKPNETRTPTLVS